MPKIEAGQNQSGHTVNEIMMSDLRSKRDSLLLEYDKAIAQLKRQERNGEDVKAALALWDDYARALCDLPNSDGAPWDGGGINTPWPQVPKIVA